MVSGIRIEICPSVANLIKRVGRIEIILDIVCDDTGSDRSVCIYDNRYFFIAPKNIVICNFGSSR